MAYKTIPDTGDSHCVEVWEVASGTVVSSLLQETFGFGGAVWLPASSTADGEINPICQFAQNQHMSAKTILARGYTRASGSIAQMEHQYDDTIDEKAFFQMLV